MPIVLTRPAITARPAGGGPIQVVATTSIIGEVVAQVGGAEIALVTLMAPGQDPHAYEPSARDLLAVAAADIVFVNGWDLEEGLAADLPEIARGPIVPVVAGISPGLREANAGTTDDPEHNEGPIDPHTWLDPTLVSIWVDNIAASLQALEPARASAFQANAEAYQANLAVLDARLQAEVADIPPERRVLVTNHDSLGYFAERYGFDVIGTVIPNVSSLAEPAAAGLSDLIATMRDAGVCAIFTDAGANPRLANTVARGLANTCVEVLVLPLYTGALGEPGSGAETYEGMMLANMATIRRGVFAE